MTHEIDTALARNTDPGPSHEAAADVNAAELARRALAWLQEHGPATSDAIAAGIGVPRDSVSPRMKPLEAAGRVRRDGRGANLRGRSATLWRAVVDDREAELARVEARLTAAQVDVLDALREYGERAAATDAMLAQDTGRSTTDTRSRRAELVSLGLVERVPGERGWWRAVR